MAMTTSCNRDQNHIQVHNGIQHQLLYAQDRCGVNVKKFGRTKGHSAVTLASCLPKHHLSVQLKH